MTEHVQKNRDHFKAIAVNTPGTPTQKLLAILADVGITDTAELVEVTGLKVRAIQTAKRNLLRCATEFVAQPIARETQPIAPDAQPIAHESATHCANAQPVAVARVEYNNFTSLEDSLVKETKCNPLPPSRRTKAQGPTPYQALQAFEAYNATAQRCGLPQAAKLTPDRQRKIIARLRDYGSDGWSIALANIEKSAFLTGGNDRGWRASLEFMLQASSFAKLHDGGYGNGRHADGSTDAPPPKKSILALINEMEAADA